MYADSPLSASPSLPPSKQLTGLNGDGVRGLEQLLLKTRPALPHLCHSLLTSSASGVVQSVAEPPGTVVIWRSISNRQNRR